MALGVNPHEQGVVDTPRRFANMWREFIEYDPGVLDTTFTTFTAGDLVIVKGIRVWSVCEHHLLPFTGVAHIAYLPNDRVVGLGRLPKVVEIIAHRPQLQENLTAQIADAIEQGLETKGVVVVVEARHHCVVSRGARQPEANTVTMSARGIYDEPIARAEVMALITK